VEVDLAATDRPAPARSVLAVGSVKWLEFAQFGPSDAGALARHRAQVPGADDDVALVAVSRNGGSAAGVSVLDAADLLSCWE